MLFGHIYRAMLLVQMVSSAQVWQS
jgi:hypothetical protein